MMLHDMTQGIEAPLPEESNMRQLALMSSKSKIARLHRKNYLQPFEDSLSLWELNGLGLTAVSVDQEHNMFAIKSRTGSQLKIDRLTYYDWCINGIFKPTIQACREGTKPDAGFLDVSFPKRRVLRFGPHNFHKYRGKFFPQLVRSLCNIAGLKDNSVVMDPMCGSGTTLVEARALQIRAFGLDKNPLSVLISKVKANSLSWDATMIKCVRQRIDDDVFCVAAGIGNPIDLWDESDLAYLDRWFSQSALADIARLVVGIKSITDLSVRNFALVCLSDVVRKASYQKEDELRVRKEIHHYNKGEVITLFREKYNTCLRSLMSTAHVGTHDAEFDVKEGDARSASLYFPDLRRSVDAIITSPPYATALPYLDTDRLSLIILGLLPRKRHSMKEMEMIGSREISERKRTDIWKSYEEGAECTLPNSVSSMINTIACSHHSSAVGFRKRNLPSLLVKYFLDMAEVLEDMKKMLRRGAPAFMVVGNNSTRIGDRRVEISTERFLTEIAEDVGFITGPEISMELLPSNDIFRKNSGSKEKIIKLSKK